MTLGQRLLSATFVAAGSLHVLRPRMYEQIMPAYLPGHRELVLASGVAEIAGGVGVVSERARPLAGWWLIATLVAVFPANVHMALHARSYSRFPPPLLWARLPLQGAFIWWVYRVTQPAPKGTSRKPSSRT